MRTAAEMDGAVTVAYVHGHDCTISWHKSFVSMLMFDIANEGRLFRGGEVAIKSGTDGLVESRNMAVKAFLEDRQADWLLWLDTDMGFEPDMLERLYEAADPRERPMVGALCFIQRELDSDGMGGWRCSAAPTIYDWGEVNGKHGWAVRWDYAKDTLTRCAGTGSACVLIHRSVFERVEAKLGPVWYIRIPNTETGQLIGEDLSFCLRLGAMNVPVYVHTGVRASHKKDIWLAEEDYVRQRAVDSALEAKAVTVRPRWEDVPKEVIVCSCGQSLTTREATRHHWQQGHLDRVPERWQAEEAEAAP